MKVVVLLGLVAAAFASSASLWNERPELSSIERELRGFTSGKAYTYRFDGQVSAGVPMPGSSQVAATRVQSVLYLHFHSDKEVVMKMQQTRIGAAHRDLGDSKDIKPFDAFTRVELTREQEKALEQPIRFRLENGLITDDVHFEESDQTWSENIKRAVLNMIQLNLERVNEVPTEMKRLESSEELPIDEKSQSFAVREKTLHGECEVVYTITPEGRREESSKLRVTKSINFDKCSKRIDIRYGMRGSATPKYTEDDKKFVEDSKKEQLTQSFAVLDCELIGDLRSYIVKECAMRSLHNVFPVSAEEPVIGTSALNKLTLIRVEEAPSTGRTSGPKNPIKKSIVYDVEWERKLEKFRMTGDEKQLMDAPYVWMQESAKKMEVAKSIIKDLIQEVRKTDNERTIEDEREETFRPELAHQMARFVEVLRVATKDEIKKMEQLMDSEETKALFFDALAMAGTKSTIDVIVEKTHKKEISPVRASRLLKELLSLRTPSEPIIKSLVSLCKHDISERNAALKQSCWLTTGSLMHELCANKRNIFAMETENKWEREERYEQEEEKKCTLRMRSEFAETLYREYSAAKTTYEKVLAVKAMANAGFDMVLPKLEEIVRDNREARIVRAQAVDAMRKLRHEQPRKLQRILLPLVKNQRLPTEIRINAAHLLLQTLPERAIIDQLTAQIGKDIRGQVASFLFTELSAKAESTIPAERRMAVDCKASLRLIQTVTRRMLDSKLISGSYFAPEYRFGVNARFAQLFTNDSVLPKEISASLDTVMAGEWSQYAAQVGVAQQNMDKMLYKLLSKLQRTEGAEKAAKSLKAIMQKMNIKERKSGYNSEESNEERDNERDAVAMLYIRHADNDYAVLPIEDDVIEKIYKTIVKEDEDFSKVIERVLSRGLSLRTHLASFIYERTRVIPTVSGIPLLISSKMPTVVAVEGELKVAMTRDGFKLIVKALPKVASTHVISMELRTPVVSTGIKMLHSAHLALPIDAELFVESNEKMDVKLTIRAPEHRQEKRVLGLSSRTATFIRIENNKEKMNFATEKTVFFDEEPTKEIDISYGEKALGLDFQVKGHVHRHLFEKMPRGALPVFVAPNIVEVVMKASSDVPREYVIRIIGDAFNEVAGNGDKPEFERFYEKETEKHFEVEDDYETEEDEEERKRSAIEYSKKYSPKSGYSRYSHSVRVIAEAVGSSKPRRFEATIKAECDNELTYCKWNMEGERTPVTESEEEEGKKWIISASAQTLFPEPVLSFKQLKEQKHREILSSAKVEWGFNKENEVRMRAQIEQSAAAQRWQRLQMEKEEPSEERLALAATLNQIKIVADYKIRPETQVQMERVLSLLKAYYPLSLSSLPEELKEKESRRPFERNGRLLIKAAIEPQTWRYANVSIETPTEKVTLNDIRLPIRPALLTITKTQPIRSVSELFEKKIAKRDATCTVSPSRIETFDAVRFRAPSTTCYTVLAKDCGSESEPAFAVLMRDVKKGEEEKKMKIIVSEGEIEFEGKKDGSIVVKAEGRVLKRESELREFNIEKRSEDVVIFENSDIRVRFDGYKTEIKLNEYYKNKQCGICGHYDGEEEGEFRRADDEETEDMEEFVRSYLHKDSECAVEEEKMTKKDNYKLYSSRKWENSESHESGQSSMEDDLDTIKFEKSRPSRRSYKHEEEDVMEPIYKTIVSEFANRVCFSSEPVPHCPKNSHADEDKTKDQKVKFVCELRSKPEAHRLMREARKGAIDVAHLPQSYAETMALPTLCIAY